MLTVFVSGLIGIAGCSSSGPASPATPTDTQQAATVTPVPTVKPTSTSQPPTPVPTATPVSHTPLVELRNLSCVDFHPGVFNPEGPNHWYDISGSFLNSGDATERVLGSTEILDSSGALLAVGSGQETVVESKQTVVFGERIDLAAQANEFTCRVSFIVMGDEPGQSQVRTTQIESIYAP